MQASTFVRSAIVGIAGLLAAACSSADDEEHRIGTTEQALPAGDPIEPREDSPPPCSGGRIAQWDAAAQNWYCSYPYGVTDNFSATVAICYYPYQYRRCGTYSCYCSRYP